METLDKFDIAILSELQSDARLTNAELAQRVGLSAAPCWRRVRALEEAGFIKGYRAEIDRHRIGLGVLAFVRLDALRNTAELTREMEEAIRNIPEIVSCHYISGAGTFELQVVSRDLDTFSQFARKVLLNQGATLRKFGQMLTQLIDDEGVNEAMAEFITPLGKVASQLEKATMGIGFAAMQNPDEAAAAAGLVAHALDGEAAGGVAQLAIDVELGVGKRGHVGAVLGQCG